MGLKTTNYTIEELGLTIPEAYAFIRNLYVCGENATAEFVIQANREKAINLAPLKTVTLEFKVIRDENPYYTAYNFAKSVITEKCGNHVFTNEMPFFGWQDDFVKA